MITVMMLVIIAIISAFDFIPSWRGRNLRKRQGGKLVNSSVTLILSRIMREYYFSGEFFTVGNENGIAVVELYNAIHTRLRNIYGR